MITVRNKGLELPEFVYWDNFKFKFLTALERVAVESEDAGNNIVRLQVFTSKPVFTRTMLRNRRVLLDEFFYIQV